MRGFHGGRHFSSIHYTYTRTHLMHYSSSIEDKTVNLVCTERKREKNYANSKCAGAIVSAFTKTHNAIALPFPGCLCVLKLWAHKFRNKVDRISTTIPGAADKIDVLVCVCVRVRWEGGKIYNKAKLKFA